ncbi:MAG: hypothetical protein JSS51_03575 [Planctomycetes bacterium]|nr:hypothetical protein [Planctomycetota bacterium]
MPLYAIRCTHRITKRQYTVVTEAPTFEEAAHTTAHLHEVIPEDVPLPPQQLLPADPAEAVLSKVVRYVLLVLGGFVLLFILLQILMLLTERRGHG